MASFADPTEPNLGMESQRVGKGLNPSHGSPGSPVGLKPGSRGQLAPIFGLPLRADVTALVAHVSSGPEAEIGSLLDHLVGAGEQRKRARDPKRLGSFEVKYVLEPDGLLDRQISRFITFKGELLGVVAPACQCRDGEAVLFGRP